MNKQKDPSIYKRLRKNHSQFDVLWNEVGIETQKHMVKNAPELLKRLGDWYNAQNDLLIELDDLYDESQVPEDLQDNEPEQAAFYGHYAQDV